MALTLLNDVAAPAEAPAPPPNSTPAPDRRQQQAGRLLGIALMALSERAVVAVASLFSLMLAGSVWWLAMSISTSPSNPQLLSLGLYGAFVLALHVVKRK